MNTQALNEFVATHVAAWNERDAAKREALLRKIYAEDITMYDAQLALTGIQPISDFIGQLQAGDATFHYGAIKPIEVVQDGARLFGAIQTAQGPLASMDFILFEDGKAAHLYAFIGPAS